MTKALFRDTLRAISRTLSRFVSIVIIVALGVGFFAGLRAVSPNMKAAAADFFDELNLADIVVQSTVGFDDEDLQAVLALPGVGSATLSRSIDGILHVPPPEGSELPVPEQGMAGTAYVVRIIGFDFAQNDQRLNSLRLVEGRFPQAANEALVSAFHVSDQPHRYFIGQNIMIKGDHEDLLDTVEHEVYEIVGIINTPEFVSMEFGASQAGGGELSGFIYVPDSAFKTDYYTTLFVGVEGARRFAPYTDAYNNLVRSVREQLEYVGAGIVRQRVDRLSDTFGPMIEEAKQELEQAKIDAPLQIEQARARLEELDRFVEEGPALFEAAERELEDAERQLEQGRIDYLAGLAEFEAANAEYEVARLEIEAYPGSPRDDFIHYSNLLIMRTDSLEMARMAHRAGQSALRVARQALNSGDPVRMQNAINILGQYVPFPPGSDTIEGLMQMVEEAEAELEEQEAELEYWEKELEEGRRQLREAEALIARLDEFDQATRDLQAANRRLNTEKARLDAAPGQIEAGRDQLERERQRWHTALARQEWAHSDFARGVEDAQRQIADAERKIRRAENQLAALPHAQWIVDNRDTFPGYTNYGDTADNMEQFALIFPVLFFLIAALVSLTTMTRMVEDERMQLGVLKATGYSAASISFKYLFYASTAGLLGTVIGTAMGFLLIPQAIFQAYRILYLIPSMRPMFFGPTALIGLVAALISTVGAVSFSVMRAMRYRPAELMRPRAPKAGKRVFLEWFPFIWKRLGFNGKVTVRNLMRNKKRFAMTFAGIMGCTALLLTGFGIGNSIGTMLDRQFGPDSIMMFDGQALLQQDMRAGDQEVLDVFRRHQPREIENMLPAYLKKMYAGTEAFGRQIDVTIAVPENVDIIGEFINLTDAASGRPIVVSNQGVFINGKTAELMNLRVGDTITIQSGPQRAEIPVAGITHNYIYHWIYMTPQVYEHFFGEEVRFNVVLFKLVPELQRMRGSDQRITEIMEARTNLARELSDTAEVITVVYNQTIIDSVGGMLRIMRNVVVAVFTGASGALAFVVLYNLNNINIYERIRELATIKVLGYNDREADMFIYRENIIISVLGIAAGLALGVPIFGYIIRAAEIESMMFIRELVLSNYIAAALVTAVFAVAINLLMHKRIKEINMVEALKSVE